MISLTHQVEALTLQHHQKILIPSLRYWYQTKKMPSALLLTGQPWIGKTLVSRFLAQWMLCENKEMFHGEKPCGSCQACLAFLQDRSEYFFKIDSPLIESFRQVQPFLALSLPEGRQSILWIPHADLLTAQTANALLKTLEEPPSQWTLILTVDSLDRLLPTLQSRCQIIRLRPFSQIELRTALDSCDLPREQKFIFKKLLPGSLLQMLQMLSEEEQNHWERCLNFLKNPRQEFESLLDWGSEDSLKMQGLLGSIEKWIHLLLLESWEEVGDPLDPFREVFQKQRQVFSSVHQARLFWLKQAEDLSQVRSRMTLSVNRKLLVSLVLTPWVYPVQ